MSSTTDMLACNHDDALCQTDMLACNHDDALRQTAMEYAARRTMVWQRKPVSLAVRILFWSLRVYLFSMLLVVGIVIARLAQ